MTMRISLSETRGVCWHQTLYSPDELKESWGEMLEEFDLADNKWLRLIYEIRGLWVHVYFKGDFLGDILRMTSSFESQNSMFGSVTCPNLSLVEF